MNGWRRGSRRFATGNRGETAGCIKGRFCHAPSRDPSVMGPFWRPPGLFVTHWYLTAVVDTQRSREKSILPLPPRQSEKSAPSASHRRR